MEIKFDVYFKKNLGTLFKSNEVDLDGILAHTNLDLKSVDRLEANYKVGIQKYTDNVSMVDIEERVIQIPFKSDVVKVGLNEFEIVAYMKNGDIKTSQTYTYNIDEAIGEGMVSGGGSGDGHYHANLTILNSITQTKINEWNNKAEKYELVGLATETFVNDAIATIELKEGPQGPAGQDGADGKDGVDGKDFTYDMFTKEQLEALRGPKGEQGPKGEDYDPTVLNDYALKTYVDNKIADISKKFVDVVIDNNNINIISSFSDTSKIAYKINVGPDGRNNIVNFNTVSLIYNDGRTEPIYSATDDTSPICAQFGYIGGNHGHLGFTLKSNGQTQEDVGSIWTDGTTDYVLAKVEDDKCYFAYNQYRLASGKLMYNKKDANANLTPKSGATNTNSLDISTRVTSVQLYPSINRHTIEYYLDDKKVVTPNGSYKCDKFVIKEQYNVMKFDAMHEFLTTHIGSNLNDDAIDGFATFTIMYEFTKGCKCNIYHSLAALDIIELTNTCFIQQSYGFNSNYTVSKIIPGAGTVDNFNFATGVNLKNITKEINIYRNNLINEDASVSRDVNIVYKDSIPQFIFTNGYLIDKTDSAKRKDYINEDLCLWKISSNKKTYPIAVNGMTLNEGDYLSFSMYRNFNPINDNVTSFNMIKNGEDIYFMIDNLDTVDTNIILDEYIGERLEILESNNFELLADTIDSNGLRFRGTDVSYAILKIIKEPQSDKGEQGKSISIEILTQEEYEALKVKDDYTFYGIKED